ncbi:hypothetical protein [Longimycelium tulufanense]|uniref:hypothetical protein n=1 Tax=Longimycelium tulufanense TaxID=907463 RepID=UPI0016687B3C|nr:hypothetical protein [Longimycelium tulufanense]
MAAGLLCLASTTTALAATGESRDAITVEQAGAWAAHIADHPHDYSGLYRDAGGRFVLTVHAGRDRAASLRGLPVAQTQAAQPRFPVTVQTRSRSYAELTAVRDQIGNRHGAFGQTVGLPAVWAIDTEHNRIRVGLTEITDAARSAAAATYGDAVEVYETDPFTPATKITERSEPVEIVDVSRSDSTLAPPGNRLLDGRPYFIGDRILSVRGNVVVECTSAYHTNDFWRVLTAGHCFNQDEQVYQGYFNQNDRRAYATASLGRVASVQWGNDQIDGEEIRIHDEVETTHTFWTGNVTSPTSAARLGHSHAYQGERVCSNGSVTGEVCGARVTGVDGCYPVGDVRVCGLDVAQSDDGRRIVEHGDSGGPTIAYGTNGASFKGIISAGNVGPGPGDGPGDRMLFVDSWHVCCTFAC